MLKLSELYLHGKQCKLNGFEIKFLYTIFFYNMHNCWNIIYYYFHCQLLYYNNHYKATKIVHML